MNIFELTGSESHPAYQQLQAQNLLRQYDFLLSVYQAAAAFNAEGLNHTIIKALNFQAIACLHRTAGSYRDVEVEVGSHRPPRSVDVPSLMDSLVDQINLNWRTADPIELSAYVLWRLNWIHPFVNGNGRTARACSYYILCCKLGAWLPGERPLPELIRENRVAYVSALREADESAANGQPLNLSPLSALLAKLLEQQLASVQP